MIKGYWITEQFLKRENETPLECVADSSGEKSPLSIVDTIDFLKQQRTQFSCQEMIQSSRSAKFRYSTSPIAVETRIWAKTFVHRTSYPNNVL